VAIFPDLPVGEQEPEHLGEQFLSGDTEINQPPPRLNREIKRESSKLFPGLYEVKAGVLPKQLSFVHLSLAQMRADGKSVLAKVAAVEGVEER
jgi:hypothetical protein